MFLMSIAGGIAYTYTNYKRIQKSYGGLGDVWNDTVDTFKDDFRLIKPKKRGFESLTEEIELKDIKNHSTRVSATVDINFNDENRLSKKLMEDYFWILSIYYMLE